jgi:hypothetical protein
MRAQRGEAAGGQAVSAGNVKDVLIRSKVEKRDEGRPTQDVQDVYKKPYTFLLTFLHDLAFIK